MGQKRLLIFLGIIFAISLLTLSLIKLAQGYRPDFSSKSLRPTGLFVATSFPDGAQVFINGKLKTATNNTLSLSPGEYEVEIKKDGFTPWKKKILVEKGLVFKTDAYLFSTSPDLKALTFTGATKPLLSLDGQKIIFAISSGSIKDGLWVLDLVDRPFGLAREPQQIAQGSITGRDFAKAEYQWSPDSKEILVTFKAKAENFLLVADNFNAPTELIDVTSTLKQIKTRWQKDSEKRSQVQLAKLPSGFLRATSNAIDDLLFAPDETKILYTATASATLPDGIISPLPARNSQPESRKLEPNKVYTYDLKEDKNFLITDKSESKRITWFGTSRHLFLVEKGKIKIGEYDNTNWVDVYTGPFEDFYAFPFPAANKILILTSIGQDSPANLYAIILR